MPKAAHAARPLNDVQPVAEADIDLIMQGILEDPARLPELKRLLQRQIESHRPAADEPHDLWDNLPV